MDGDVTTSFAVDENESTASGRGGKLIIVPRTRSGRRPRDCGGDSGFDYVAVAQDELVDRGHFADLSRTGGTNVPIFRLDRFLTRCTFNALKLKYLHFFKTLELSTNP